MPDLMERILFRAKAIPLRAYRPALIGAVVLVMFYIIGLEDYLFFQSSAEVFGVAVMLVIFVITWNAREYLENNYLLFLGISLIFVACIDFFHVLFFGGIGIPMGIVETNEAAGLWLAARYLLAFSLIAAPFFVGKKLKLNLTLTAYTAVTILILLSLFQWHLFPASYIDGIGQTVFQKASEFIISALFFAGLVLLLVKRATFEKKIFILLILFVALNAISQIFFVFYDGTSGLFNLAGQLIKVASFYFLYRALIVTGFKDPYKLFLRSIKNKAEELEVALFEAKMHEIEMDALFQSSRGTLEQHNLRNSAKIINTACKKTIGAEYSYVVLRGTEEKSEEFVYRDLSLENAIDFVHSDVGQSLIAEMEQTKEIAVRGDFVFTLKNQESILHRPLVRNALLVPLVVHGRRVGHLALANKPGGFTKNDVRVANVFGKIASLVLYNQRVADELKASEQKFRSVAESLKSALVTVDYTGKITFWNKSAEHIFGYRENEIVNKQFDTLGIDMNILPTVEGKFVEMRALRKGGEELPVEISSASWKIGNERFYSSVIRDITERKKSEHKIHDYAEEMREAKSKNDALLLSIADGILAIDTSGKVTYANKAFEELCGIPAGELLNRDFDEVVPVFDHLGKRVPKEKRPIYVVLDPRRPRGSSPPTSSAGFVLHRNDGKKIAFSASAAPFIVDGKIIGAVVVWHDITKRIEVDKAKNEFISFASHQLRTPLTSVGLSIDMLLTNTREELTKDQKKYLKIALTGVRDMTDLIETLLNISRIQMGTLVVNPELIRLQEFSDEVLRSVSMALKDKGITVKKHYDKTIPALKIDERLMRIVFENLISNAMKYGPAQGTIMVEIKKQGRDAVIAVSDMGEGIPKDQQEKIFERLFRVQTDSKVKGTGLGLYIVRAAVDQYGGRVWCESPSSRAFSNPKTAGQKGTTFFVTVPLAGMSIKKKS